VNTPVFSSWAQLDPTERTARLRAVRALAQVYARPHREFVETLNAAETDSTLLDRASELFEALPALSRRRLLAAYSALVSPRKRLSNKPK
jgi:hypothetical protein